MELPADRVPAERADDAEAVRLGVLLDRPADHPHRLARLHGLDAEVEALLGHADQLLGPGIDLAHAEGGVGVAVHAAQEDRDVDVDDVTVAQRAVVGDAVTDHLVHRGAHTLREALVPERAGVAAVRDVGLVRDLVEEVGGDAGCHCRTDGIEHLTGRDPRGAHGRDHLGRLHQRLVAALRPSAGLDVRRSGDLGRHLTERTDGTRADRLVAQAMALLVLQTAAAPAGVVRSECGHPPRLPVDPGVPTRETRRKQRVSGAQSVGGGGMEVAVGGVRGRGRWRSR